MRSVIVLAGLWLAGLALPSVVLGHGVAADPGSLLDVALAWSLDPLALLGAGVAGLSYWAAARRVGQAHPQTPVPRWRRWCWYAGLAVILVALASPIATYDTVLFSAHMVQHLLLTVVAAPLLALGAPVTVLLRVVSAQERKRFILPLLHSRPARVIGHPVVAWVVFAAVMYGSHFSPLFDLALENESVHVLEHGLYMAAALLFWWPVVGADPSAWRMPHPARIGYLFLGMPWSSFLGLAIYSAPVALYRHYATVVRAWGPSPLADQQLAGGIMWVGGDGAFLVAMLLAVWVWLRAEEVEGQRVDARLDREAERAARVAKAAIGERVTR